MVDDAVLIGGPGAPVGALADALRGESFAVHSAGSAGAKRAAVLVTLAVPAGEAMRAADAFIGTERRHGLIALGVMAAERTDWPACRDHAVLAAFTRHAALAHAPGGMRINLLELAGRIDVDELARAIAAMWRWRSMTGQAVRLAGD